MLFASADHRVQRSSFLYWTLCLISAARRKLDTQKMETKENAELRLVRGIRNMFQRIEQQKKNEANRAIHPPSLQNRHSVRPQAVPCKNPSSSSNNIRFSEQSFELRRASSLSRSSITLKSCVSRLSGSLLRTSHPACRVNSVNQLSAPIFLRSCDMFQANSF